MPLTTFTEVKPWAVAIKEEVLARTMPPWPASKGFGDFQYDLSLPQEEINLLAAWAEGGAPEGEAKYQKSKVTAPAWRPLAKPRGDVVMLQGRLTTTVVVLAVRGPGSGKIWVETPTYEAIPLVWWMKVKPLQTQRWLVYRTPVRIPAGSVLKGRVEAVIRYVR